MSAPAPAGTWEGRPIEEWRAAWGLPRLLVYQAVESTNDVAFELAAGGAPAGSTVLADYQTRGRGQRGREWHAPAGRGLLLSVLLRPPLPGDASPGVLPVRVGLAVAAVLERLCGFAPMLKWPNDIVADGRKLGGILCEGALAGDAFHAVAGIGLNVLQTADELPAGVEPGAVSLALLGRALPRARLAGAIAAAVAGLGEAAARPLSAAELREFAARDILRDRGVTCDGSPIGVACGLAPDGSLLVAGPAGRRPVHSGTIRPADGRYGRLDAPPAPRDGRDPATAPDPRFRATK